MHFVGIEQGDLSKAKYAVFVIECWSGDLNKVSKNHYYETRVKLAGTVELDQMKEQENQIKELEKIIEEKEKELAGLYIKLES